MCVGDGVLQMPEIAAGPVPEASFEDVALDPGGSLHGQCDRPEEWLHEAAQRLRPLDQDEMQVVRHDDEREQPCVRPSRLTGEPTDHEVAQRRGEPVRPILKAGREVEGAAG